MAKSDLSLAHEFHIKFRLTTAFNKRSNIITPALWRLVSQLFFSLGIFWYANLRRLVMHFLKWKERFFMKQFKPTLNLWVRILRIKNFVSNFFFQMSTLMLQIMEHPIEFRVLNMFSVNYKLLFSILSVSTSYLIVLLQYEIGV